MSDQGNPVRTSDERTIFESLIDYLRILISYRWLLFIITVIAVAWAVVFSIISSTLPPEESPFPNQYASHAVLLMQQEEGSSLASMFDSLGLAPPGGSRGGSAGFDYAQLALRILQSPAILDVLVDEFDIVNRYDIRESIRTFSREAILARSVFDYERNTGTITVSFESIDPVFSKNMVIRMVELLGEWFSSRGGSSRLKQKKLLEEKLSEVSADISILEVHIKDFQEKYGFLTVEELATSQTVMLGDLRSQLILKEMEIINYTQFSKIEDPALVRLKSERNNLINQISRIEGGFTNSSGTVMPAKRDLPEIAQRYQKLTTDIEIQRKIYEALSQHYELTKLSLESEPVFQILEDPEIPDRKSGPSRGKLCIIVTFMAFLASIILALILNSINKMRKNPSILKKLMGRV